MTTPNTVADRVTALVRTSWFWPLVAIVVLLGINVIADPTYLRISVNAQNGNLVGNLIDILRASAPIIMIAVGMALVIATRGIDLSVGSTMVVSGAVSMEFLKNIDSSGSAGAAATAVAIALVVSTLIGVVNGLLITALGLQPFISTLIMMLAGRGIAKVITSGQNTNAHNEPFQWLTNGYVVGIPVVFVIALAIVGVIAFVVRRSAFGLMIESIGVNPKASRMAGIRPVGILMTVYMLSGLLAGIAGIFAVGSVMTVDVSRTGYQMELDAILAVVIGGTSLAGGKFYIGGAVMGSILIATLDKTIVFLGIPASATPAFKAVVIVALCLVQSQRVRSLFGRRGRPIPPPSAAEHPVAQKEGASA